MIEYKKLLQGVVVILGLMALVFVSAVVTLKAMTWGKTVGVPDVRGKDLAAAVNLLVDKGLEVSVERQEHHPTVPENAVVYQDPEPGIEVKKGRSVSVVVSLGSEEVVAPMLKGEPFRSGQVIVMQKGLVMGEAVRVTSSVARNTVIAQYPAEGTVMQKGTRIDILLSNGPQPARFVTPAVVGRTLRDAQESAGALALKLVSGGKGGVIVSQNPAAGIQITAGSPLYVTLGSR